jgi:hypothetical protein
MVNQHQQMLRAGVKLSEMLLSSTYNWDVNAEKALPNTVMLPLTIRSPVPATLVNHHYQWLNHHYQRS